MTEPGPAIRLREVIDADLRTFFEHQLDEEAARMAAFTAPDPSNRARFLEHWARIRADPTVLARTVEVDGAVVGHVASYLDGGRREVTYWIDRAGWGRGIATEAVRLLLDLLEERPLYARVAEDNVASRRVLEKCGFARFGTERGFAHARRAEIAELVLRLDR